MQEAGATITFLEPHSFDRLVIVNMSILITLALNMLIHILQFQIIWYRQRCQIIGKVLVAEVVESSFYFIHFFRITLLLFGFHKWWILLITSHISEG